MDKRQAVARMSSANVRLIERLLQDHQDELDGRDLALQSWLLVHAVTGIADGAMAGPPDRLKDPAFVDAVVNLVLGAIGKREREDASSQRGPRRRRAS